MDRRRAVAGLMAAAIAVGLYTGSSRPQLVQATAPAPGVITTIAGASLNSEPATTVPMQPWGVAAYGSTLYLSDLQYPGRNVVRLRRLWLPTLEASEAVRALVSLVLSKGQ